MGIDYIVIILLIVSSFIVNVSVIIVLACHWKKLNGRDIIALSLGIVNLIESIVGYPYLLVDYERSPELPPSPQCIVSAFVVTATAITTISHIVMMSVEMYMTLGQPFTSNQYLQWKKMLVYYVVPCWLYGLLWAVCPLLGWSNYGKESNHGYRCSINLREWTLSSSSYNVGLLVGVFILPILVSTLTYVGTARTLKRLRQRAVLTNGTNSLIEQQTIKQQKSLFIINVCTLCLFVVAWTPYSACVVMVVVFGREPSQTVLSVAAVMAKTSALYSSLIYTIIYKRFRRRLRETWNKILLRITAN